MSKLVILLNILILPTIYGTIVATDFTCNDNECSCSHGDCHHICLSQECTNKYFMCPSSATSCVVNCQGNQSCKDVKIYGSADTIILNCNGTHACDGTQLLCGTPPSFPNTYLSKAYRAAQFNGPITDCFVNLLTPNAMRFADILCDGSITNCIINAYDINSISQSLIQCKTVATNGNGCQLNCLPQTNCNSIEFECNSASICSCGIADPNCGNAAVHVTKYTTIPSQPPPRMIEIFDQYNCMDLSHTELQIRSVMNTAAHPQGKESAFSYEICGKDSQHNTILFRYKYVPEDINDRSLSPTLHSIHHSVYFIEHEQNGRTYNFEWEFNDPNIICWLTDELSAIKIDVYYDTNISFAFTYIYSEDILAKQNARNNNRYLLTAKNNWNLGITYLMEGFMYFDYHYNITLYNPLSMSPTAIPTINPTISPTHEPTDGNNGVIIPIQTVTDDSHSHSSENLIARESADHEPTSNEHREREVMETTNHDISDNNNNNNNNIESNVVNKTHNSTPIKALLFGIALVALLGLCCIIGCIIYHQRKRQKEGMEATYASAAGGDSSDETTEDDRIGIVSKGARGGGRGRGHGNEADIDDSNDTADEDDIAPLHNERMSSGILDENDLMDDSEYVNKMHANMCKRESNSANSQSSLIKKYIKRDPNTILPAKFETIKKVREDSMSQSRSESGIGYIAKNKQLKNHDEDMHGLSDDEDESLVARDRDISMDAEYHHVITHQPEISIMHDYDEILNRDQNHNNQNQNNMERENSMSISISEQPIQPIAVSGNGIIHNQRNIMHESTSVTVTYSKEPNVNNIFKKKKENKDSSTLGFEPGSILDHYANQDSTLANEEQHKRDVSVSQSMSRLSQSLSIPPIELNEDITNVKTYKTKTTVQSAAASMKLFSQKIAKAAVKFGHNPLNPQTSAAKRKSNEIKKNKKEQNQHVMDENDNEFSVSPRTQQDVHEREDSNSNQFATMVIYKNENASNKNKIPPSQIQTSSTPPPIPSIDAVHNKFLEPQSTQTMIVKNIKHNMKESKSLDGQLNQAQTSNDTLASDDDDDCTHSTDDSSDSNDKDPIDVSEEEDVMHEKKRHRKNLSSVSNKSHHDRRSMVINDDLSIKHLVNSIEEETEEYNQEI